LARAVSGILTITLPALRDIATRPAMTASAPMERETVALSLEAILTVTLVRRSLRRRRAASDEGRQTLDVAVIVFGSRVLRMTTAKTRLFAKLLTRREELGITRQIGLRIPGAEGGLFAQARQSGRLVLPLVAHVVARIVTAVHCAFATEEGCRLPELFLRRRNQAEVMLRVLEIILRRNRVS